MNTHLWNDPKDSVRPFILLSRTGTGLGSSPESSQAQRVAFRSVALQAIAFCTCAFGGVVERRVWVWLMLFVAGSQPLRALQLESTLPWREQVIRGDGFESSVVEDEGRVFLRVVNKTSAPCLVNLGRFESPNLDQRPYAWIGEVRYKGVEGAGFLESWNEFDPRAPGDPKQRYFSRTKGDSGPMAELRGSSPWRTFALPFTPDPTGKGPVSLELNLHLAGAGVVEIGAIRLMQPKGGLESLDLGNFADGWWTPRQTGLFSGVVGGFLGCSGALLGALIKRGKGRSVVFFLHWILIAAGVAAIGVGLYARVSGQPAHVWSTCVLLGLIAAPGYAFSAVHARRQYIDAEMRRMQAADARL